ncbi:MAG: DKNYY domain-containing protein [Polyangiaceae bacterium]
MFIKHHGKIRPGTESWRQPIPGADVASFEALSPDFARDDRHVYWRNHIVEEANPTSFVVLDATTGKDAAGIFIQGSRYQSSNQLDLPSLVHLGGPFFRDEVGVICIYYTYDSFDDFRLDAEAETFEPLARPFGRDRRHLFNHQVIESGLCAKTFETFHPDFARDRNGVYFLVHGGKDTGTVGLNKLAGADPLRFRVLGDNYASDGDRVFWFFNCGSVARRQDCKIECRVVDGASAPTFAVLQSGPDAQGILPDGYDRDRLFLSGRALPLGKTDFSVRVTSPGRAELLFLDLDRLERYLAEADEGTALNVSRSPA